MLNYSDLRYGLMAVDHKGRWVLSIQDIVDNPTVFYVAQDNYETWATVVELRDGLTFADFEAEILSWGMPSAILGWGEL